MNPFRYGCVVAGENFCPRPALQRQLRELVKSGQNVVVRGPRRMGKTSPGTRIGQTDVKRGLRAVFAREQRSFASMKSQLTTVQLAVLTGLAAEERAKVFSGDFLERNGIRNVGSVTKALKRLVEGEYVFEYEGGYRFENPFFRAWLLDC